MSFTTGIVPPPIYLYVHFASIIWDCRSKPLCFIVRNALVSFPKICGLFLGLRDPLLHVSDPEKKRPGTSRSKDYHSRRPRLVSPRPPPSQKYMAPSSPNATDVGPCVISGSCVRALCAPRARRACACQVRMAGAQNRPPASSSHTP